MQDSTASGRPWAVITGASGGIGADIASLLAEARHNLVLVARSGDKLRTLADQLAAQHGIDTLVCVADLADPAGPSVVVDALAAAGIDPDVLVNNAGVGAYGPFVEATVASSLAMIQLNIAALTELTARVVPAMVRRGHGRVLQVASTAAFQPGPLLAVYYATKAYVLSFSEALGQELVGTGVTVTTLCPGPTQTDFQARANLTGARLLRGPLMMGAREVARQGVEGMFQGRSVVIPGLVNTLTANAPRLLPRRWMTALVAFAQARDGGR